MNAPLDRIRRARERKARRFTDYFLGQIRGAGVLNPEADKAALEKALAQVRDASREMWAKVADEMKENGAPSGETFLLIVAEFERLIANADAQAEYLKGQAADDAQIFQELLEQRHDPEIHEATFRRRKL